MIKPTEALRHAALHGAWMRQAGCIPRIPTPKNPASRVTGVFDLFARSSGSFSGPKLKLSGIAED